MSDGEREEEEEESFDGLFRVAATPAYGEVIRSVEPRFPEWLRPSSALDIPMLERICRTLAVDSGSTVLDLGCGGGGPALWVAQRTGCSILGVDGSELAVETARKLAARLEMTHRSRFVHADATATGLGDASVDAVMSLYAMMFIEPYAAAREIARVLRPGGVAVILSAETLVEPPPIPTLVPDYATVFEAANLEVLRREAIDESIWRAFFQGVLTQAEPLCEQAGRDGEALVEEAKTWFERGDNPRARDVFVAARRR